VSPQTEKNIYDQVNKEPNMEGLVIRTINNWIKSFNDSKNPAVKTEVMTGIEILIKSGLDTRENIPSNYELHVNPATSDMFNDVKGIINTTQDDNCGGTGDIGIEYNNGSKCYYSVTKFKGSISKCIINPSSKYYGIHRDDHKIDDYFVDALKWLSTNHGELPNDRWRRKTGNPAAAKICGIIASTASDNWNSFTDTKKKELLLKFMDIDEQESTNTKGIIFSTDTGIMRIYNWHLKKDLSNCLYTKSDGIYVYHCSDIENYKDTWFLQTQVKFNNGMIELPSRKKSIPENEWKLKNGDLFGSWNVKCKLEQVFDMNLVYELGN